MSVVDLEYVAVEEHAVSGQMGRGETSHGYFGCRIYRWCRWLLSDASEQDNRQKVPIKTIHIVEVLAADYYVPETFKAAESFRKIRNWRDGMTRPCMDDACQTEIKLAGGTGMGTVARHGFCHQDVQQQSPGLLLGV